VREVLSVGLVVVVIFNCNKHILISNYWVSGHCLSSGIINTRKHDVSEIFGYIFSCYIHELILVSGACIAIQTAI
jgi:hypothetical protein